MKRKRDDLMRPYLPPIRIKTSGANDGGRDQWLRNNHALQDVNVITTTVDKGSADLGSRKMREMTDLHPEDAGEGKPRGFGRRNVGARTPLFEHLCFHVI